MTLPALLALAEKATPGPWVWHWLDKPEYGEALSLTTEDWKDILRAQGGGERDSDTIAVDRWHADYIAACAPEVVAALVRVAQEANIITAGAISVDGEPECGHLLRRALRALDAALSAKEPR